MINQESTAFSQVVWSLLEEFEDTKGVIRTRISKDRHHKGRKKKEKRTNNDLQNITHKTKDQVTRIPLTPGGELRCPKLVNIYCTRRATFFLLSFL